MRLGNAWVGQRLDRTVLGGERSERGQVGAVGKLRQLCR
jgi:hypothetical protein